MSQREDIRQLLPAYVLGILDTDKRRLVEDYLAAADGDGDDELDRELLELTRRLELLADELPPERPSELTRARILRQVGAATAAAPAPRPWLGWVAATALFLVCATLGWQNFTQRRIVADLVAGERRLQSQVALLRAELDRARAESALLTAAQRVVAAPGASRVVLAGLADAPTAVGTTYLDPGTARAVFYAADLPPLDADRTYQLWYIGGEGAVSGGTFDVDERGEATLVVEGVPPPQEIAAWAVTIESAGGVPQPTGPMVLKG